MSVSQLEESEDQYVQAERRINGLKNSLDEREKELTSTAQKLQEALSSSAASTTTIKQLEEAVQRYLRTQTTISMLSPVITSHYLPKVI